MASKRQLNPAFAAAHGLAASDEDSTAAIAAAAAAAFGKSSASTDTSKRFELLLKEARMTGKLQASNAGLKSPLPVELFDLRAGIVVDLSMDAAKASSSDIFVHTEETLTLVDVSDNALDGSMLDERILRYEQVQVLRSKRCGLVGAKVDMSSSLEQLMVLDLQGNQLTTFCLDFLPRNLQELNLTNNRIQSLHCEASSLPLEQLVSMDLSHNQLEALPDSFRKMSMPRLRSFICPQNRFKTFDLKAFESAQKTLQTLDLSHNLLQGGHVLDFSQCSQLQTVLLSFNRLTVIPCIPPSVTRLDLTTNRIESILGMLSLSKMDTDALPIVQLIELLLQDNHLVELDAKVLSQCIRLCRLDLSANKLKTLPYQLGFLPQLEHLNLAGNPLYTFKASEITSTQAVLQKLRNRAPKSQARNTDPAINDSKPEKTTLLFSSSVLLQNKSIHLVGTGTPGGVDLAQLAHELRANPTLAFEITGQFILDDHQLETLADDLLPALPNLTGFSLSRNSFVTLPPSLALSCPHLMRLNMAQNALTQIDDFFGSASRLPWAATLTHLNLSSNRLSRISGDALKVLSNLQVLNLSFNKLASVENWHRLPPMLTQLDLSHNALEQVDNLILLLGSHCPQLELLQLQSNCIYRIPSTVGLLQERCPNLKLLDLKANRQHSIRPEILSKPTQAQLTYLTNRLTAEQKSAAQSQMEGWCQHGIKPAVSLPPAPAKAADAWENPAMAAPAKDTAIVEQDDEEARIEDMLSGFRQAIAAYENQLESASLSQAKRYAVKKSLAMERSKLIREERTLGIRK